MTRPTSPRPSSPIRQLVERCAVLSLDIFDTALLRRVEEPSDVFRLVEAKYRATNPTASQVDFAGARIAAEARARQRAYSVSRTHEVTLAEIYEALRLPADWDRTALQDAELEVERALLVRNPYIYALYRVAVERGVPVVFLSDMYLPSSFLARALDDAGYDTRALLLVSAESASGSSKATGGLYREAITHLGVRPDEILHIGDNEQSDVASAMRRGLSVWHYRRCGELGTRSGRVHPGRSVGSGVLRGLVHNRLWADREQEPSPAYATGYAALGPLWHHHAGDESVLRRALALLPHDLAARWRTLLSRGDAAELLAGASDFHAEFTALRSSMPWLDMPAVDVALALDSLSGASHDATLQRASAAPEPEADRWMRLALEYLVQSARRERDSVVEHRAQHEADPVWDLSRDLVQFRRRFAPATSLRARGLDWTLLRARDLARVALGAFDLRDALLDDLRARRRP